MPPVGKRKRLHHRVSDALNRAWRWTTQADLLEEFDRTRLANEQARAEETARKLEEAKKRKRTEAIEEIHSKIDGLVARGMPETPSLQGLSSLLKSYDAFIDARKERITDEDIRKLKLRIRHNLKIQLIEKYRQEEIDFEFYQQAVETIIDIQKFETRYGHELVEELRKQRRDAK